MERVIDLFSRSSLDLDLIEPEGGYYLNYNIKRAITKMPTKYFYNGNYTSRELDCLSKFSDWVDLPMPDFTPDVAFICYLTFEFGVTPSPFSTFYPDADSVA
jgi:hypothetical protein